MTESALTVNPQEHWVDAECSDIHTISVKGTAGRLVQGGADAKALDVDRHLAGFRDGDQGDGARPIAAERYRRCSYARRIGRWAAADDLTIAESGTGVGASRAPHMRCGSCQPMRSPS